MNLAFCSQNEKGRFCLPKSCDYKTMAENNKVSAHTGVCEQPQLLLESFK
jgi:hypothetical protein